MRQKGKVAERNRDLGVVDAEQLALHGECVQVQWLGRLVLALCLQYEATLLSAMAISGWVSPKRTFFITRASR